MADLDRRLEAIAVQHPKIVQPLHQTEPGLSFVDKAGKPGRPRSDSEREIIIDSAPLSASALGDVKQRLFGGTQVRLTGRCLGQISGLRKRDKPGVMGRDLIGPNSTPNLGPLLCAVTTRDDRCDEDSRSTTCLSPIA